MSIDMSLDGPDNTHYRAEFIAQSGGLEQAMASPRWPSPLTCSCAEMLLLGLLRQGVKKYLAIFGHGSTQLGEVLRHYQAAGVTQTFQFRNEVAMAHAATALSWGFGEISAVVTSIGPGALQAMAGSLTAISNGVGVYHLYGDETTHGEGDNMQQIPAGPQGSFGQLCELMSAAYTLHTPEALREALRRGTAKVHHPHAAGPFSLLLPINTQPQSVTLRVDALPERNAWPQTVVADEAYWRRALEKIKRHPRIVIKAGGGTRTHAARLREFAERIGAVVVQAPGSTGVLPDQHPQNMHVGGSKGSISGNYAMENAELLIAIGSRGVCQSDCSGIGYPKVREVININADFQYVQHYNHTTALCGDAGVVLQGLIDRLGGYDIDESKRTWLADCAEQKQRWQRFKQEQMACPALPDVAWQRPVMTQPLAIKVVADFAKKIDALKLFDAGDVQANGFQLVEDDQPNQTLTDSGASYMGFAASGLMAAALADASRPCVAFSGDGSFMMNPQVLIDAVAHGLNAILVIFDNRRMAAITGLQQAQYGAEFCTHDDVAVDYVQLANAVSGVKGVYGGDTPEALVSALNEAHTHPGLSVVHVPVYAGEDARAGMGAYGRWNVGNWCADVQAEWHAQTV